MRVLKSPSTAGTAVLWSMIFLALYLSVVAVPVGWRGAVWTIVIGALYKAILGTWDSIAERLVYLRRRMNDIETYTVDIRKMEILSHLTDKQIEWFQANTMIIRVIMGQEGIVKYLQWANNLVPFTFIDEFLSMGEGDYLCPIRRYPEGSHERDWSTALTAMFVNYEWAEPASGNRPARWTENGYEEAFRILEM